MLERKSLWIGFSLVAALALIAAMLFVFKKPALHGAVIDPPLPAAEIRLTDHNGNPFQLSALRGMVVLLFFGYTNCPDECPLTMAHLKEAYDSLGDEAAAVRVAMVSTDPARDTPTSLKEFAAHFDPSFLGLTGPSDDLAAAWHDYGVAVLDGGETHSTFIYVIDKHGNIRETFLPESFPDEIASDVSLLLREE
jgi:protein SCO1/2